jgi:hypothetical protein
MMQAIPDYSGPFAFFKKHFNGDYSLARSYWVNTTLISFFAPLIGALLLPWLAENFAARYASMAFIFTTALGVSAWFWAVSGTWASANKHVSRGGHKGWATAAKVMIVFGLLKTFGDTIKISPLLMEHLHIAAGEQLGPQSTFEVLADGKSIRLNGGINDGTANQLVKALALAPSVTTVLLSSQGGWVREGEMLAKIIEDHGLDTYVETQCASACTIAFLAGKTRAADPAAKIGFHSLSFVGGGNGAMRKEESEATFNAYANAGLPADFLKNIANTPKDQMWYPSHEEMIQAGVLTRKSFGGESAAFASLFKARADIETEFNKLPLYSIIKQRQPATYKLIIDAAWAKVQQGRSDAEIMTAGRTEIGKMINALMPLASNETLVEYADLMSEQLKVISKLNTSACVEMIFPSGAAINFSSFLPKELQQRELELMYRVVKDADSARANHASEKQVQDLVDKLLGDLSDQELAAFSSKEGRESDKDLACLASVKYLNALAALPDAEKAKSLRIIYSMN